MNSLLTSIHYVNRLNERQSSGLTNSGNAYFVYFLFLIVLLSCSSLSADEVIDTPFINIHNSVIHNPDISGNQGVITVNVSAGNNNVQANVGVIAIAAEGSTDTSSLIIQKNLNNIDQTPDKATANITGHAFSNSNGWTAVNQVSGQVNQQANMLEIGIGEEFEIGTVNDQVLAQSFSGASELDISAAKQNSERSVNIDDTALSGMRGVIQVNQTAGTGNVTSNTFVFHINGMGN